MKSFIDATIFMGMHSSNERIRIACKNFFIDNFGKRFFISLENVGICDNIVWSFSRRVQDSYYPFMDRIHTIMNIKRVGYDSQTLRRVKYLKKLSTRENLTIAQTVRARLYTFNKKFLELNLKEVITPKITSNEKKFPKKLEGYYKKSLRLKIKGLRHYQ